MVHAAEAPCSRDGSRKKNLVPRRNKSRQGMYTESGILTKPARYHYFARPTENSLQCRTCPVWGSDPTEGRLARSRRPRRPQSPGFRVILYPFFRTDFQHFCIRILQNFDKFYQISLKYENPDITLSEIIEILRNSGKNPLMAKKPGTRSFFT